MIQTETLFEVTPEEQKALDAIEVHEKELWDSRERGETPILDRYWELQRALVNAVGVRRWKLRQVHWNRKHYSNEETGPWCDDVGRWHPHGKYQKSGRGFDSCKYCNLPVYDGPLEAAS